MPSGASTVKCTKNAPTPVLNTQNIYGINHDDYKDGQRQTNLSLRASSTETRFLSASALQKCSQRPPEINRATTSQSPKEFPTLKETVVMTWNILASNRRVRLGLPLLVALSIALLWASPASAGTTITQSTCPVVIMQSGEYSLGADVGPCAPG